MSEDASTIVWITGATSGIGAALARTCPWPDTKIISISRREHPDHETVPFEMSDMDSWYRVGDHLKETLATFRGERAVFIHNALLYPGARLYQGEGDPAVHQVDIIGNVVSPLILGDLFLRAARPAVDAGVDCGLVQISSASARIAYPGLVIYCAAKASMEQWVRGARAEPRTRGKGPWVRRRPGFVDTPAARRDAELPEDTYPGVKGIAEAVRTGKGMLPVEEAAMNIWNAIPDDVIAKPVLLFGEAVGVTT